MELVTRAYNLRNSGEFLTLVDEGLQATTMSGRLCWNTCLSDAFGNDFHELLKVPEAVGLVLGCAARIFKAIIRNEQGFDGDVKRHWQSYLDGASGLGFVGNTVTWFPELRPVKQHMESGAKMKLAYAMAEYRLNLRLIERACPCSDCKGASSVEQEGFCLAVLLETIISLSYTLAGITVAKGLYPSRAGVELFYIKQRRIRMNKEVCQKVDSVGPIDRVLEITARRLHESESEALADGLREGFRLFVEREPPDQVHPLHVSAISAGGLCVYLDILRDLSLDRDVTGRVHVVPGRIEWHGKPFDLVSDREDPDWLSAAPTPTEGLPDFTDVTLVAEEKVRTLKVNYILKDKKGTTVHIPPARLVYRAGLARGLVSCGIYQCENVIRLNASIDKLQTYELHGKQVVLAKGDQWFLCAVLCLENFPSNTATAAPCILRTDECIQCCFRSAAGFYGDRPVLIISPPF